MKDNPSSTLKSILLTTLVVTGALLVCPPDEQAKNIRDPDKILAAIEVIIKDDVTEWCRDKGLTYPPEAVVFRIFKQQREFEIWAKNAGQERMQLVATIPICSMDFKPGPKLRQGDGKTPEGFYQASVLYGSQYYWMWIDLDDVEAQGEPGKGSSFKLCTDYPNSLDLERSRATGNVSGGRGICIHGNCVTAGCPSFSNRDFLTVFAFARHHNEKKYGKLQVHMFPFRFPEGTDLDARASESGQMEKMGKEALVQFWKNLKQGYDVFKANPNPLKFRIAKDKYRFD